MPGGGGLRKGERREEERRSIGDQRELIRNEKQVGCEDERE